MKTVWIMIFLSVRNDVAVGPEFDTAQKCEDASYAIMSKIREHKTWGEIKLPFCVEIKK